MIPFLKNHERLILGLAALAVILFCFNRWINSSAATASAKDVVAQQQLQAQKDMNAHLEQDAQQKDKQYEELLAAVTQQIQGLQTAMTARDAQLAKTQQADKAMPLPELGGHWEGLVGVTSGIQTQQDGMLVTDDVARATVDQLDQVPALKGDLQDDATIINQRESQITALTSAYESCQQTVSGLNAQVAKQDTACKAQVADVKAQARKSKRNWFIGGLLTGAGIVARLAW